jgi:hypothetical protein
MARVTLDDEAGAALHLIVEIEVFARSASVAKMAKLARAVNEAGRNHTAIRLVVETIIDALNTKARR